MPSSQAAAPPSATQPPRPVVLLGVAVPSPLERRLAERFELLGPVPPPFARNVAALPAADLGRVRALVTIGGAGIKAQAMSLLPALELVACLGSGFEEVDVVAARARGIRVTHSPNANAAAVADLAMGLTIASVRRFHAGDILLRSGQWQGNAGPRPPARRGLTGRRMGIYGLGAIGALIAQRARAFAIDVGYHSRHRRTDVDYPYFATLASLADWCDILVIAVRADAATRHSVDAGILAALGADGHVVNIARGSVIDEAALVAALDAGTLGGAGLDVYEQEPHVPAALLDHPSVVATPHIGGATLEAQDAMSAMLLANLDAWAAGTPLPNPVPA
ncbi:MAG: 2-hydroxyacid dehydrogenase [Proteobacteria bacterium]|nr:2-hydroxyacid dehydrogenase [Pseudomonadota bacterium]